MINIQNKVGLQTDAITMEVLRHPKAIFEHLAEMAKILVPNSYHVRLGALKKFLEFLCVKEYKQMASLRLLHHVNEIQSKLDQVNYKNIQYTEIGVNVSIYYKKNAIMNFFFSCTSKIMG